VSRNEDYKWEGSTQYSATSTQQSDKPPCTRYRVLVTGYYLLFVALPSIPDSHLVPSGDISNLKVYESGDRIFMV
jgi:hypothetical protein